MIENDDVKIDVRGGVEITVYETQLVLTPKFANLARAEQATGKTAVMLLSQLMSGNVSIVDLAKVVTACAEPAEKGGKLPKPWNHVDVGQDLLDNGYTPCVTAVITFLGAALTAKPKKRTDAGGSSGE